MAMQTWENDGYPPRNCSMENPPRKGRYIMPAMPLQNSPEIPDIYTEPVIDESDLPAGTWIPSDSGEEWKTEVAEQVALTLPSGILPPTSPQAVFYQLTEAEATPVPEDETPEQRRRREEGERHDSGSGPPRYKQPRAPGQPTSGDDVKPDEIERQEQEPVDSSMPQQPPAEKPAPGEKPVPKPPKQ